MASERESQQRQRLLQAKEVGVFALLASLRVSMTLFAGALASRSDSAGHDIKAALLQVATGTRDHLLVLSVLILMALALTLLSGRLIPRRILDLLGLVLVFNLFVHFLKINLLLLTPPGPANLLLGQLGSYLLFFVLAWGWIFWRVDRLGDPGDAPRVLLGDSGAPHSMFDYYHHSMLAILNRSNSSQAIRGVSRRGKLLVVIHHVMVLDLLAIAVGRFYQLIQRTL